MLSLNNVIQFKLLLLFYIFDSFLKISNYLLQKKKSKKKSIIIIILSHLFHINFCTVLYISTINDQALLFIDLKLSQCITYITV